LTPLEHLGWNPHFQQYFEIHRDSHIPGRIFREEKNQYGALTETGETRAKLSGRLRRDLASVDERIVVGDWVSLKIEQGSHAVIEALLPRKSAVSRKLAGSRKSKSGGVLKEQVIAANMDIIFILTGLYHDFNPRRIERYLALVWNSGASPVVVLNKVDLCHDLDDKLEEVESSAIGVPIHAISAKNAADVEALRHYIPTGVTAALLGSSGVGKSTLINTLLGYEKQKVKTISESMGKGLHTTTHRELIQLSGGGFLMDNPGMREIQLWGDSDELDSAFQDIEEIADDCRFRDCQHLSEPDCAVRLAVEAGELSPERLESFHKLKRELRYLEERQYKTASVIEREKWKTIHKSAKSLPKKR
jgi:ribosome biogenesis GTPase